MEIRSEHRYRLPARRPAVWAVLADVAAYRDRWPWLRRFEADRLAEGQVWRCTIRPPLPYTIRCRIELATVRAPDLVVARVDGDITGDARLDLVDLADLAAPPRAGSGPGADGQRDARPPGTGADGPGADALDADGVDADRLAAGVPGAGGTDADDPGADGAGRAATGATEVRLASRLTARSHAARTVSRLAPAVARWGHDWVFDTAVRQLRSTMWGEPSATGR